MGSNNKLNDSLTSWTISLNGIGQGPNNASQILLIVSTDCNRDVQISITFPKVFQRNTYQNVQKIRKVASYLACLSLASMLPDSLT